MKSFLSGHLFFAKVPVLGKLPESWLDVFKGSIYVLSRFSTSQHDLTRCEYQKTNFRLLHVIDQARESLRVKIAKHSMITLPKPFQLNLEVDRTRTYHILNSKITELYFISCSLNSFRVFFCSTKTMLLTLCPSDNHLTGLENQSCCTCRLFHSHYDSGKSLGVVFSISTFEGNVLQIQLNSQICGRNKVLKLWRLKLSNLRSLSCSPRYSTRSSLLMIICSHHTRWRPIIHTWR